MKIIPFLATLMISAAALAGERIVSRTTEQRWDEPSSCAREIHCGRIKNAGTPGAFYHSNFSRNAVILCNDTPDFMTFFVYSGDVAGTNEINHLIRVGAHVYEVIVPPYQKGFTDQRGREYWVGSKKGKWAIDLMTKRVVAAY